MTCLTVPYQNEIERWRIGCIIKEYLELEAKLDFITMGIINGKSTKAILSELKKHFGEI